MSGTQNETLECGTSFAFYDSGGPDDSYSANESGTTVICPDVPGSAIIMEFTYVDIETSSFSGCFDQLTISDGNGTLVSGCGEGSTSGDMAGPGADNINVGDTFTSTAADGCLTVSFSSDGSVSLTGWAANLNCGLPPPPVPGCTDPNSCNYDPSATVDDGSCEYSSCVPVVRTQAPVIMIHLLRLTMKL